MFDEKLSFMQQKFDDSSLLAHNKINENQKIEFSGSLINEYRFGGQMIEPPAFKALQSEERQHNIAIFGTDYQWNFKNNKGSLIFFGAYQYTKRNHFTGVMPDSNILEYFANPPYGNSDMNSFQFSPKNNYKSTSLNFRQFIKILNDIFITLKFIFFFFSITVVVNILVTLFLAMFELFS